MIIPNREQLQEQLPREQYQELVELYGALGKPSTEHRSSWGGQNYEEAMDAFFSRTC